MKKEKDFIIITFRHLETNEINTTIAKSFMTLTELLFIYNQKNKKNISRLFNKYFQEIPLSYRIQSSFEVYHID